jgi:type IV pilus assembly protein PilE
MSQVPSLRVRGFSLIELMIVVAIIAILAAIAYPSYTRYVLRTYRAQAKADLVEYAGLAERYHTANNTYVGFSLTNTVSPRDSTTARYDVSLSDTSSTAFTLTAAPTSVQSKDSCGTLSINQASVKTASGDTVANCW